MARASVAERERQTLRRVLYSSGDRLRTHLCRAPLCAPPRASVLRAGGGGNAGAPPAPRKPRGGLAPPASALRGPPRAHGRGGGPSLDASRYGLAKEQTVAEAVREGADVVTFSGDKLLGGPQAGLAVGRTAAIAAMRSHPLMRAVRPDKLTLASRIATLASYRDGAAERELPVWRMLPASQQALAARADAIVS